MPRVPLPLFALAFGADALLAPAADLDSWHHRRLTLGAAREAGWSEPAAQELAGHSDGIDRMLFNPAWVAAGGPRRIWGAAVGRRMNQQLHFDDLRSRDLVAAAWQRYLGGVRCALAWAARRPWPEAIAIARCAVGLTLHAVQDFYAHSTWIDLPSRRSRTWQEGAPGEVVTGTWALPARPRHGEFGLRGPTRPIPMRIPLRAGVTLPPAIGGVSRGITLDSHWQAPLGARERGIDLDGDTAFAIAADLAHRSSVQVLAWLAAGADGSDAAARSLWREVSTGAGLTDPFAALEDPALMPQPFLAAGASAGVEPDPAAWFLRVEGDGRGRRWHPGSVAALGPFTRRPRAPVPAGMRAVAFRRGACPRAVT